MKRILIVPWHNSAHTERAAELREAARRNVESGLFDRLLYVTEEHHVPDGTEMVGVPHRPTYAEVFAIAAGHAGPDDMVVIANSDISFDDTLRLLNPSEWEAYALSRRESGELRARSDSQDVWIFRGPPKVPGADFYFGVPACDNRVLYLMVKAGYQVTNPAKTVVAHHHHSSDVRTYKSRREAAKAGNPLEFPPEPFRLIDASFLNPVAKDGTKVLHVGFNRDTGCFTGCFTKAFEELGCSVSPVYWPGEKSPEVATEIAAKAGQHLCFLQLHTDGVLSDKFISRLTGFKVNWCGDVRIPRPAWFLPASHVVDITAFSNETDLVGLRGQTKWLGDNVHLHAYHPVPGTPKKYTVAFSGNHYPRSGFPETKARLDMVKALRARFGDKFCLCGRGWPSELGAIDLYDRPVQQAEVFRQSLCATNIAHALHYRYYSDRIYRIMACGTLCLSKRVPGMDRDFIEGTHYLGWDTPEEMIKVIESLTPETVERIGAAGCRETHAFHTTKARCITILGWADLLQEAGQGVSAGPVKAIGDGSTSLAKPVPVAGAPAWSQVSARVERLRALQRKRMTKVQ